MKTDRRVDAYIKQAAPFSQPILRHLRAHVHRGCPEVEEAIKWGMPAFLYRGKILCGMAAFKAHATFGFWHQDVRRLLEKELGNKADAMGGFGRITAVQDLPPDRDLQRYIRTAVQCEDSGAPRQEKPKARPAPAVPPDLAAALKKNRKAATTFENFAPSHRREYIEWITGAKREATRAQRLATTLAWLAEGKSRHWKYQDC
jgi:uncharacterized protein YdeI (YjbR/CyaY-like superfamily)